jgi:transposase InsO family protein
VTDDIHLFNEKLREWEDYYNYHRPPGALDGQTPYERLLSKTKLKCHRPLRDLTLPASDMP